MCGLDQATMAQSLSCYISIIDACRQGQQKIRTFAVSCLLTSWIKKFSFPRMQNRQFIFEPKMQYALTAERSEAAVSNLQFPKWCPRLESNQQLDLRRVLLYPFNYEGKVYLKYYHEFSPLTRLVFERIIKNYFIIFGI